MKEAPIFIHSLFRSGSTYLFSLLRRSPEVYCYYESMHELVAWAADDVSRLEGEAHADKMRALHHPVMEDAYFSELREVWPCWKQLLKPRQVYEGYFSDDPEEAGVAFFKALNKAAPRRAVFSECPKGQGPWFAKNAFRKPGPWRSRVNMLDFDGQPNSLRQPQALIFHAPTTIGENPTGFIGHECCPFLASSGNKISL